MKNVIISMVIIVFATGAKEYQEQPVKTISSTDSTTIVTDERKILFVPDTSVYKVDIAPVLENQLNKMNKLKKETDKVYSNTVKLTNIVNEERKEQKAEDAIEILDKMFPEQKE